MPGSGNAVKMWLNDGYFSPLVDCLCERHPTVCVGSAGLPFYCAVGTLDAGCQTNKLEEM